MKNQRSIPAADVQHPRRSGTAEGLHNVLGEPVDMDRIGAKGCIRMCRADGGHALTPHAATWPAVLHSNRGE